MGRIKKDHSGWRTHGIFIKYQQPSIENNFKVKAKKKDTKKWCHGKPGVEHELYRHFEYFGWESKVRWIKCECKNCGKRFYRKHDSSIPLTIPVDYSWPAEEYLVQVKVNDLPIPIESKYMYSPNSWYCLECDVRHYH